jgi:branched-chain amino acid transport system permease protein
MIRRRTLALTALAVALLAVPAVVTNPYHLNLFILAGLNAALGATFLLLLRTGLVTMAIAAFLEIGATTTAALMVNLGWSFWPALLAGTVATTLVAWLLGIPLARSSGFTFVMLTSVVAMLVPQVFASIRALGGFSGIQGIPAPPPIALGPLVLELSGKTGMYYLTFAVVGLCLLALGAAYAGRVGRAWSSIGLHPRLAGSVGVDVVRYRRHAFVLAGAIAGLVGGVYAVYLGAVVPSQFSIFKTINVHIGAILGGVPFALLGPLVGSGLMTALPEMLRSIPYLEPFVIGTLYIVAILLLPDGVLSLLGLRSGGARARRWWRRPADDSRAEPNGTAVIDSPAASGGGRD